MQDGKVLFLGDSDADPFFITDTEAVSQPLRFFALDDSPKLAAYLAELSEREMTQFEREKKDKLARAR